MSQGGTPPAPAFVRRYTAVGGEVWTRPVDSGGVLAADSTGVYVGGATVSKLDPNGNPLWKRAFAAPANAFSVGSMALDATGLYLAGGTEGTLAGQCKAGSGDMFVRKYDTDGSEKWTRQFGTSGRDSPGGLTVDSTGVYVSGGIRGGPAHGSVFVTKLEKTPLSAGSGKPQISQECVVN